MNTPIVDYVKKYADEDNVRLHMPGHKGRNLLGFERMDITEIDGADELFAPNGIIEESMANASSVFGCPTFYSAQGSTACIQAMIYLTALYARSLSRQPFILAARNAHRSFVNAAALVCADVKWIYPKEDSVYYSCGLSAVEIEEAVIDCDRKPDALYLTSPDYLGNISDIRSVSAVCKKHGILLLVDNAHGAYLKFLTESMHPVDLGADSCCDSAHKTLPVITGGAYLHLSKKVPQIFSENANKALALFSSSSPSYLILQSLDNFNALSSDFKEKLEVFVPLIYKLKNECSLYGYDVIMSEPMKLTFKPSSIGYDGFEFAEISYNAGFIPEFYDRDFIVYMFSPYNGIQSVLDAECFFLSVEKREMKFSNPPKIVKPAIKAKPSDVIYLQSEVLPVDRCEGRICAYSVVGCPPAVPVVVCGEVIDRDVIACLKYYGNETCCVAKE